MTSARKPGEESLALGALRQVALRVARMDRHPIPPTERLTATEKLLAQLAMTRRFD